MIAITHPANQLDLPRWQRLLGEAVSDPAELLALLELDAAWLPAAKAAARLFPLRVPRGFIARMRPRDPADPLLRQVLPLGEELQLASGFSKDPVGDLASRRSAGLLHKYRGRALLIATGACGVHCRYCFRRHFPYGEENASAQGWQAAIETIRGDATINEVILSGGDPLSLSDRRLARLVRELEGIGHVGRLRIHTRQPVVLPERVDDALLEWLSATRLQKVVVLHVNHAQEIDAAVERACRELKAAGAALLNQSVLLAGVNDSVSALCNLSEALFAAGVLPYYLHLLDRVQGAAHFEVDELRAATLMRELLARLPGYLAPKLVREIPAQASKTPIPF
jgi:L-lysine 2,3-aminomutase